MERFDHIVIGQGIAGTTLAWQLRARGQRVLVVDSGDAMTSSRVSAGLVTLITGKRCAETPDWERLWKTANRFYDSVSEQLSIAIFKQVTMLRLFRSDEERVRFEGRRSTYGVPTHDISAMKVEALDDSFGGFEMLGGQLDALQYLDRSREFFERDGCYRRAALSLEKEVALAEAAGVRLPTLNCIGQGLTFCQGFQAGVNPWFNNVIFEPAKGEILDLEVPELDEQRVVHRGCWLASTGAAGRFRLGATYSWDDFSNATTPTAREELQSTLSEFLTVPFKVTGQHAAVRPIVVGRQPVIGVHAEYQSLSYFNGLGSRGALVAPLASEFLARRIVQGETIEERFALASRFPTK